MFFLWLKITVLFSIGVILLLNFEEYKAFCSFKLCQICLKETEDLEIILCTEGGIIVCKNCISINKGEITNGLESKALPETLTVQGKVLYRVHGFNYEEIKAICKKFKIYYRTYSFAWWDASKKLYAKSPI